MAKCVFIVQGEGRGHMSQSMALSEYLEEKGHTIERVFTGCRDPKFIPGYFYDFFRGKVEPFHSPYFLQTPNKKGIYIGRTLLINLMRSLNYLGEVHRLRQSINRLSPEVAFNFYDVVGSFSLKKVNPSIKRIGIGHHFYLHLDRYQCNRGPLWHRWLLSKHTSLVMQSCDRVLALSHKEYERDSAIEVVPPLVRKIFREITYKPGHRYLVYLLNEGYLVDLIRLANEDPGFEADVFTAITPEISLPAGIKIHQLNDEKFREMMAGCKGLFTNSGFDTVAEAAYHGIPMLVVPSQHHFEQRCNGVELKRNGMGLVVDRIEPGIQSKMKAFDSRVYREWIDKAGEMIINRMEE